MYFLRLFFACSVAVFLSLQPVSRAEAFTFESLRSTQANTFLDIYDWIFPVLASAIVLDGVSNSSEQVVDVISYVNFYSTPHMYKRYSGLGTGGAWRREATVMMCSGNLLCSEQSALAAMMLEPYLGPTRVRDASHHTLHEANVNGRWVIVDPYGDMRIRNRQGGLASFDDIQSWLGGDKGALVLNNPVLPRTGEYLELYAKENFASDSLKYGETVPMPGVGYSALLGLSIEDALKIAEEKGMPLEQPDCYVYLTYVRNNVFAILSRQSDKKKAVYAIQDFFFKLINDETAAGFNRGKPISPLYFARGYQLLGRYEKALGIYKLIPESEQINFFISQCYFKMGEKKKFNSLNVKLSKNLFYRYMYYLMNGKYLKKSDEAFFKKCMFKHVGYN